MATIVPIARSSKTSPETRTTMPTATRLLTFVAASLWLAAPVHAQHHQHQPYAGQQSREIKALSDSEIRDLLTGAGMGFAKSAELNRYPGPTHALEHAEAMRLTPEQKDKLAELVKRHKAEARCLGERVIAAERALDALFASRTASAESVDRVVAEWGAATARLRAEHLKTHLETTALLTPAQVERYVEVRGYASASGERHSH
jgi:hypothetical protein